MACPQSFFGCEASTIVSKVHCSGGCYLHTHMSLRVHRPIELSERQLVDTESWNLLCEATCVQEHADVNPFVLISLRVEKKASDFLCKSGCRFQKSVHDVRIVLDICNCPISGSSRSRDYGKLFCYGSLPSSLLETPLGIGQSDPRRAFSSWLPPHLDHHQKENLYLHEKH